MSGEDVESRGGCSTLKWPHRSTRFRPHLGPVLVRASHSDLAPGAGCRAATRRSVAVLVWRSSGSCDRPLRVRPLIQGAGMGQGWSCTRRSVTTRSATDVDPGAGREVQRAPAHGARGGVVADPAAAQEPTACGAGAGGGVRVDRRELREDQTAPRKQRHTAKRIFERLCDEHGRSGRGCPAPRPSSQRSGQGPTVRRAARTRPPSGMTRRNSVATRSASRVFPTPLARL
jgi:hypothetical protein